MRNPSSKAGAYGQIEAKFIRDHIGTMNDVAIAKALNWKPWKVIAVRKAEGIPAHCRESFWTDERLRTAKARYITRGEPGDVVAKALGCSRGALQRKCSALGWKRPAEFATRNAGEATRRRLAERPETFLGRRRVRSSEPSRAKVQPRRHFGNSAFSPTPPKDREPLGDRIALSLARRPMSAPTLAALLDVKELAVSMQLAAMAAAGLVVAGPAAEVGVRNRVWSKTG